MKKISDHRLSLGISTHSHFDLALALSIKPSYIALGPIYKSNTKSNLTSLKNGISKIYEWKYHLKNNIPLIAIGGINEKNLSDVYSAGANGAAVIEYVKETSNLKNTIKTAHQIYESCNKAI